MKKFNALVIFLLCCGSIFSQSDKHGNPVFISEVISEEKFDKFELTSSYYTVRDNITNKESSVYVKDTPGLQDYLKFSRDLPSYFFIVHSGKEVKMMIILLQKNTAEKTELTYNVVNPNNGKAITLDCNVWGEISEKRVDELQRMKVDTAAKTVPMGNGKMYIFDGIGYRIQAYDKLKAEVLGIITQILNDSDEKKKTDNPGDFIKQETIGGNLDFNKILEKEDKQLFIYDGVEYNKNDFAILLWGKKVSTLDVNSSKKAVALWEEIHKRKMTETEKKALVKGFKSKD